MKKKKKIPVFTVEEFKEHVKKLVGLRPTPYYNPPAQPSPLVRRQNEQMKTCKECNQSKSIEDFYKNPTYSSGRENKCKECRNKQSMANERANPARYHGYHRKYNKTPKRRAANAARTKRYRRVYPEKFKAHRTVAKAKRAGRLVPQPCKICGKQPAEAHHSDYSKRLKVKWFCKEHHIQEHNEQNQRRNA